jgi:hypothetical protein
MPVRSRIFSLRRLLIVCVTVVASLISISVAQEDERRIWDSEFVKKRNAPKTPTAQRKTSAYRRATPKNAAIDEKAQGEMVGVTLWRLRQSATADNKEARLLLQDEESGEAVEWTPERVEAETIFSAGDRVRLSIESPRDGFLYVIDREQYADGTLSEPYLIFPTLRIRSGNNAVTAGRVIELPDKSVFRLTPLRPDYKGEVLTILVTDKPIADVQIGPKMMKLDAAVFEQWEKQWGAALERFELIGGAGKTYTRAEKEAGMEGARLLTQEDELPQTLYRVLPKPGNPLMVKVPLQIGK